MKAEEFNKYEGKRTTGRVIGCDLEGGRIIGYDENDNDITLLAIDDTSGWDSPSRNDVVIPNDKDRKDYFDGKHKYLWVRKNNVYIEKDFDLTEILKGCEGIELWSDICGKCKLESSDGCGNYEIEVFVLDTTDDNNRFVCFTKYGRLYYRYPKGKCLLWPSETNRDWSTFKKPVRWVVCSDYINSGGFISREDEATFNWKYIIPYDEFRLDLTEEELNKLNVK